MGAGQFSIFGATEENAATDFRGFIRIKQRLKDGLFFGDRGSFHRNAVDREISDELGQRNIHRERTGNAERRL